MFINVQDMDLISIIHHCAGQSEYQSLFNNAAQVFNHEFFWNSLTDRAEKRMIPTVLADKIVRDFKSYDDFELYRSMALRSHVNSKFSHKFENTNHDVDVIASLISSFNIWNKHIPDMIRGYFDDMELMIRNISKVLIKGAKCYIVVANSGYKGILVPTDLLLSDIAVKYGFKVCNIYHARKIRSSSQQMHILTNDYDNLMRESVIELQLN